MSDLNSKLFEIIRYNQFNLSDIEAVQSIEKLIESEVRKAKVDLINELFDVSEIDDSVYDYRINQLTEAFKKEKE